jgi:hypothetical protein
MVYSVPGSPMANSANFGATARKAPRFMAMMKCRRGWMSIR